LENHLQLTGGFPQLPFFFWFPEEPSHPNVQVGRKSERLEQARCVCFGMIWGVKIRVILKSPWLFQSWSNPG
jgi:hypothetical protein